MPFTPPPVRTEVREPSRRVRAAAARDRVLAAAGRAVVELLEDRRLLAATLSISGPGTVDDRNALTVGISAASTDPSDPVQSVTIYWGDGDAQHPETVQTVAGNPTAVGHTYNRGYPGSPVVRAVARTKANLTSPTAYLGLDSGFGARGRLTTDFGGTADAGRAVMVYPEAHPKHAGKVLVAGTTNVGGATRDLALARYHRDGGPDASFDGDGRAVVNLGAWDEAYAATLQEAGGTTKILVVGERGGNFVLARVRDDGSLDSGPGGFANGLGYVSTEFGSTDIAKAVAV